MIYFIVGVESTILVYLLGLVVLNKYREVLASMYKAGYSKSQTDDTAQLLTACKLLPYEYGNTIWKALTKTDLPEEKVASSEEKVIEGFKQPIHKEA